MTWTQEDAATAAGQGWGLYDIYEAGKTFLLVQKDDKSKIFLSDEAARLFVEHRAKNNDALALKAVRLVFNSRVPDVHDIKKGKRR